MRTIPILVLTIAAVATANTAGGATPKMFYWTTAQANAAVISQATRPYCTSFPADTTKCANGKAITGLTVNPIVTRYSDCVGVAGKSVGGRYREFTCKVASNNEVAPGTLDVFTANSTKIRWKRV